MGNSQGDSHQENQVSEGDPPPQFADDQFYQVLAALQRRRLLYYLLAEEESTLEELVTVLGGWDATDTGTMHTPAERLELRLTLIHNHLPRLAKAGLINYDSEDRSVQLASLHPRVADVIRQSIEAEPHRES